MLRIYRTILINESNEMRIPDELDAERASRMRELTGLNAAVHQRAMRLVGPLPVPVDLTMQQLRGLMEVAREPGIAGHSLGERLGVSPPTASGIIDRLVDKGLVRRTEDPDDRRVRRVTLTEAGQEQVLTMDSIFGRMLAEVVQAMSLDDLDLLLRSSQVILEALDRVADARA